MFRHFSFTNTTIIYKARIRTLTEKPEQLETVVLSCEQVGVWVSLAVLSRLLPL